MRVLVACEESQAVCKAFRELDHEAYSCDILPCSGGHPEWHIQGDVLEHLNDGWDLMIAHPPCTYFAKAGLQYLHTQPGRTAKLAKAFDFWLKNLPKLEPTNMLPPPKPLKITQRKGKFRTGQNYYHNWREGKSAKDRSKTFPGIAKAMAEQWGKLLKVEDINK